MTVSQFCGEAMLGKAILVTILGALVTGGAVYIAQNPDVLDPLKVDRTAAAPAQSVKIDTAVDPRDEMPMDEGASNAPASNDDETTIQAADKNQTNTRSATDVIRSVIRPPSRVKGSNKSDDVETDDVDIDENSDLLIDEVMAQAEQIKSPDLRDQAYLDIVDYAVKNQNFGAALVAMETLRQPQLRDTARSKIAVQYAKFGQTEKAFDLIEEVEIEELRDFMRLQVIEALIVDAAQR